MVDRQERVLQDRVDEEFFPDTSSRSCSTIHCMVRRRS